MTDWAGDLRRLLGDIQSGTANAAEYTPFTAPINDIAAGNFGNIPGEIVGGAFRGLSLPQDVAKYGTGALIGGANEGLRVLDEHGVPVAGFAYEPKTHQAFMEGGPRAAWEQVRSEEPAWFQLPTEIGIDPLTAFGMPGRAPAITKAFEEAALAPRSPVAAAVAGAGADFSRGADILFNRAPYEIGSRVARPIARVGKAGIQRVYPQAFEFSPKTVVQRKAGDVKTAWQNKLLGQQGLPGLPAVIPGTTKSLSPFDQYDVPPFFDTEFDSGVPRRIKELAWDSWQALKMSQPGIPGVNQSGMTLNPAGPLRMEAQRPNLLGRIRGMGNSPLGFIAPPPGGYKQLSDVRLDEDNLRHMATIGAAVMLDYDNDLSNRLFGKLIRANEGATAVKDAVSEIYGGNVTPAYLPGAYDEMERLAREGGTGFRPEGEAGITEFPGGHDLPHRRFISEGGWPTGTTKTDRVQDVQRRMDAAIASGTDPAKARKDALAEIRGSGFRTGSPESIQATENAAGFGAGHLAATRPMDTAEDAARLYDPFSGEFRPKTISSVTGRAAVPRGFEQANQFDVNAAAYNKYMTDLFGQMPADELETLRKMSVEVIYNELLNAAAPVTSDATTFLRKGRPRDVVVETFNPETGKTSRKIRNQYGEGSAKSGGYADPNDPRQIGNRADEIEAFGDDVKYVTGKATLRSLNSAYLRQTLKTNATKEEFTRLTGKKAPGRDLTNAHLVEMIEALGGTPFIENRVGGPLPNAQRLVDMFQVGKDLQAGSYPSPEFYDAAAEEIRDLVGPGRYEDAALMLELLGITSSSEGVEKNAINTLRLYAEWKVGSPEFAKRLMDDYGLTPDQVKQLLTQNGEWTDPQQIFRRGITSGMRDLTTKAFSEYVARAEGRGGAWSSVQGGAKTHNYTLSSLVNVWRDAIDYSLAKDPKLQKVFRDGLDKAMKALAWDRHMSRVTEHGTEVSPMQAVSMRELGLIAAEMGDISPEQFQSGLWYLVKDQQGFTRIDREDDVAFALRRALKQNLDPSLQADVRLAVNETFPGLKDEDPEQFDDVIDGLMKQEALYAIMDHSLAGYEDRIAKATGERNPLRALFGMAEDTVGIVNRANQGAPPYRTPNAIQLQDIAATMLGNIRKGSDFGATFGWDGTSWVPEAPTSGYAVALTSAGKSTPTAKVKTSQRAIEKLLLKYTDILDNPSYSDKLKFGLFQMDDFGEEASFDLTLIVPDEATAVSLARRFNQRSIYDFAGQDLIDTGGSGDPVDLAQGELKKIIDGIYGKPTRQRPDLREAMKKGIGIAEMDSVNPVSILNRRVLGPIMEKFHDKSVSTLTSGNHANIIPGEDLGLPGPVPDDAVFDFGKIGQDPMISTQENVILNQTFDDGEKYHERLGTYLKEARDDQALVDMLPQKWGPRTSAKERLAMVEGDETLTKIVRKYNDAGIDIAHARPEDIAMARFEKDLYREAGVEFERQSAYDLFRAAWGETALLSPRYHTGNIQGSWLQNAIGGTFELPGPDQFFNALKYVRAGRDDITRREALHSLHAYQTFQRWGFDDLPSWLMKGGVHGMTGDVGTRSAVGKLAGKVTRNERIGSVAGIPFEFNADTAAATEIVMRGTMAEDVLEREMMRQMPAVEASINRMAAKQGLGSFEFSILDTINPVPGGPTPARLKDHLIRLGFNDGYATRASRNFAEAKNVAEKAAKAAVEKHQFSYDRTNLDEVAGKFIPFLYWYSRALRFWGENALRYPPLMVNYMREQDGIEDIQNDPGLSARQKGFIKMMGTPLGFSLLMNPEAMMGVVKVFGLDAYENPEDTQISAGKVLTALKDRGIGLYPWIEGTLNLMGVFGDTYEPDLLGIRHKALIGSAVNFMRSQLGMEPAGAPYAAAMGQLRGSISSFVSQFTPDWLTRPVTPRAGGSITEASMDTIIESRIIARNPNLTNGELLDIMSDPDSPEYIAAYRDAASAGLIQQLLNFTLPQTYKLKEDTRDVRSAQVSTIYEAAAKQGVSPYEFKPTVGDTAFAARYEQLTGKTWQPGDYEDAQTKQELARSVPEAKPLAYQVAEYNNLGTPEQQRRFEKYQAVLNGENPQTVSLDYQQRRELANAWASKLGYTNDIASVYRLRDAWEQSHPEFAAYKGWQSQMFDLKNHLGGSLAEYRRQASQQNPNAARYFADAEQRIRDRGTPPDQIGLELDQATVSVDAFTAINGMPTNRYDQGPVPGVPPVDFTLPAVQGQVLSQGQYQPTQPDWQRGLSHVGTGFGTDTYGTWFNNNY